MHSDHCHGFDDLRAFFFRDRPPVTIHATRVQLSDLTTRFSYAFTETSYHGTNPKMILHEIIPEFHLTLSVMKSKPSPLNMATRLRPFSGSVGSVSCEYRLQGIAR
jgi:phosphoribosyl 1,2-cyclic phosphodiesterase